MITVNTVIANNEWFFTYNEKTKEVIKTPEYVDKNTSAIIGDNVKAENFQSETECWNRINELGLRIKPIEHL
ncbi:MAG TPA: hypothetical protein VI790_05480 [Candidatus Nanoarchaeia archaeon]|nr:hypothetical protein [Candidatus Nanoarchaeia archaeon]